LEDHHQEIRKHNLIASVYDLFDFDEPRKDNSPQDGRIETAKESKKLPSTGLNFVEILSGFQGG
jgi:hypothetical protein